MLATRKGPDEQFCRIFKHHHTAEGGRALSRNQEELVLIAALGAFWFGITAFSNLFLMV